MCSVHLKCLVPGYGGFMLFLLKTVFYSQKSTNPSSPGDTRLPVDWDIVGYIPSTLIFLSIRHLKVNKNPLYFSHTCIRQKAKGFPRMRIFSTTTVIPSPAGGWCGLFRRIKNGFEPEKAMPATDGG